MNFFLKYLVFLCLFRYLQMKFLRTFNPRIDADAFIEALEQNWEWNVILIKRHRIKLVLPLFFVCVSLWLLALMLYIIYVNIFESNKMIYRALATFYLFTSLSWTWFTIYLIFSETVCQINSKKKYYDSVEEMEPKQRIFSLFLKRSFIVFIVHLLFLIFNWSVPLIFEFRYSFFDPVYWFSFFDGCYYGTLLADWLWNEFLYLYKGCFRIIYAKMNFIFRYISYCQ